MVSQNAIACSLIVVALLLLAVLNHMAWLLWLVPLSFVLARLACGSRGSKRLGAVREKG